jgi:DNA-binding NtrC family response regulator
MSIEFSGEVRRGTQRAEQNGHARAFDWRSSAPTGKPSPPRRRYWSATTAPHPSSREIAQVAPTYAEVVILVGTGTGKELYANYIYTQSCRAGAPFVPVNCSGLSIGLIENELFGHVGGAFTGARPHSEMI